MIPTGVAMAAPLGANGQIVATATYEPGYYPKGISINNSVVVTLQPGTYMFGGDVSLGGQSLLAGAGVIVLPRRSRIKDGGTGFRVRFVHTADASDCAS